MCPLDIVPQSGPKGKCCPGKAKKDLPFSTNRPVYPCGKIPPLSGLLPASHLPQGGRQVSPSCRGVAGLFHVNHAWLALSCGREKERLPSPACHGQATSPREGGEFPRLAAGFAGLFHVKHARLALSRGRERVPALSGLPWASHLPQRRRRVFPPCLGFAGLFHVKHARLVLSRERERVPALSGLPWASHLPQRGRQVSPSCRGVTGLFHVKRKRQRSFRLAASPVGNE